MGLRGFCLAAGLFAGLLLAGCSVSALDPRGMQPDYTAVTGAIPVPDEEGAAQTAREGHAVLAALAGGLAAGAPQTPFGWEASDGESRGTVTWISDESDGPCRSFVTTRESFDGVALYRGSACLDERTGWRLQSFERSEG